MKQILFYAVVSLVMLFRGAAEADPLSCPLPHERIPVFEMHDGGDSRYKLLVTDLSVSDAAGRHYGFITFYAVPPLAGACPSGTKPIYGAQNMARFKTFYTADKAEYDAKLADVTGTDPGWTDLHTLDACVADAAETRCDVVPLFRYTQPNAVPAPYSYAYHTEVQEHQACTSAPAGTCQVDTLGRVWPKSPPYVFRTYTEPYVQLSRATAVPVFATPKANRQDEVTTVDLPFPFTYYGNVHNQVKVSTNGILTFNPPADDTTDASPKRTYLPSRSAPLNMIAGWWAPSIMQNDDDFLMQTLGTAPNRRFVVQWGNGYWVNANRTDIYRSMQIQLFEGSGRIEVHHGIHGDAGPPGLPQERASIGLNDPYGLAGPSPDCGDNCLGADWPLNTVAAFMPEPHGYIVREVQAPTGYQPLTYGDPDVGIVTTNPQDLAVVDLGFTFEFDGQKYSDVLVSTGGAMTFNWIPPFKIRGARTDIPPSFADVARAGNVIAPWWDEDLRVMATKPDGSDGLLYARRKVAGHNVLIVEWQNLTHIDVTDAKGTHTDPRTRRMQVQLIEGTNEIVFYYSDLSKDFVSGQFGFDHATAGMINSVGDGTTATFRLLQCTPDCLEAGRDRTVDHVPNDQNDRLGSWPTGTMFLFTPDPREAPTWHTIYRDYFMADKFAPPGEHSAAHCGNCHTKGFPGDTGFQAPEDQLFDLMFLQPFGVPEEDGCGAKNPGAGSDTTPLLSLLTGGRTTIDPLSSLLLTDRGPSFLIWMSEPAGGYFVGEHMPWDAWCDGGLFDGPGAPSDINDEAKSRLKRWILQNRNTP